MLYHPHRILEELKTVENIDFKTFAEVYNHCYVVYVGIHLSDYYGELPLSVDINEFEEDLNGEDNIVRSENNSYNTGWKRKTLSF